MRAVRFTEPNRAEIVERPRPHIIEPDDAIVMVTTAGLTAWDVARCEDPFGPPQTTSTSPRTPAEGAGRRSARIESGGDTIPGGEFAGNIVEMGPAVKNLHINDLVFALSAWREADGALQMFGADGLDGGHADYVRVPHADRLLVKTAAGAEERSLLAGGTFALGAAAAEIAKSRHSGGWLIVAGCDALAISTLAALHNTGAFVQATALDFRPPRLTVARRYGATPVNVRGAGAAKLIQPADTVIAGEIADWPRAPWTAVTVRPGGTIIFTEPDGIEKWRALNLPVHHGVKLVAADWPAQEQAAKLATLIHIRKLDLMPVVSHVIPLEEASEAYSQAVSRGPAVMKVLLKP